MFPSTPVLIADWTAGARDEVAFGTRYGADELGPIGANGVGEMTPAGADLVWDDGPGPAAGTLLAWEAALPAALPAALSDDEGLPAALFAELPALLEDDAVLSVLVAFDKARPMLLRSGDSHAEARAASPRTRPVTLMVDGLPTRARRMMPCVCLERWWVYE